MTLPHGVVWDEGMLLSPQHFQQLDRHLAAMLRRRFAMLAPHGFGLTWLSFELEALIEGEFGLRAVAGILPGGFAFEAPDTDPLPARRSFKDLFEPRRQSLGVHLAMPAHTTGGVGISDSGIEGNRPTPFVRRLAKIADDLRPGAEREIAVAVPNLRLLFDGEVLEGHDRLQIAEIQRAERGGFTLAPRFVPTCLSVAASPVLQELLGRMVAILSTRSEELSLRQQRSAQTSAGAANLWLLHTLNGALPELLQMHQQPRAHPWRLHLALARLAAHLCTFTGRQQPRSLPQYDHENQTASFAELDKQLTALLDLVITSRCVPVPLERSSATMLLARLPDRTLVEDFEFYLAVTADVAKDRLEKEFPAKVKVSSQDGVQELLTRMVPGLPIQHVVKPPDEVPVEPGRVYFHLDKSGPHWASIAESLSFGFHVPPGFTGLQMDLLAAKTDPGARK
jgi:type VI secretion system protein ImpJ